MFLRRITVRTNNTLHAVHVKARSAWDVFRRDRAQGEAAGQKESWAPRLRCPASDIGSSSGRARMPPLAGLPAAWSIPSAHCESRRCSRAPASVAVLVAVGAAWIA